MKNALVRLNKLELEILILEKDEERLTTQDKHNEILAKAKLIKALDQVTSKK